MSKTIAELSEDFVARFARDLYHCSSCNYCVDAVWPERGMHGVCATMEQHSRAPGYSGRGYIEAARALVEGQPLAVESLAERVFACTTCGNCETACPLGLRPATIGRALREELIAIEALPPAVASARDAFIAHGNPYGVPREQRRAWLPADETAHEQGDLTLFAGCAAALPAGDEARASLALLRAAGVTVRVQNDACCGAPLSELGMRREGEALARAAVVRLGADDTIVAGCECRRQFAAVERTTRSVAAWLCEALAAGEVQMHWRDELPRPTAVRLVESCQLKQEARGGDEAAVAALLAAHGVAVMSDGFPNRHATCCGAAGGMAVVAPASTARMARACLPQAGIALSLDPRCANHLRACAGDGVEVLGFATFIERYFRVERGRPA